uniref:Uncharacterized protein n=1 Tax=Hyaloperonospora arabidopsidis (strain Emoy2) TaxID=559515 RepID=M4B495_HYAAE
MAYPDGRPGRLDSSSQYTIRDDQAHGPRRHFRSCEDLRSHRTGNHGRRRERMDRCRVWIGDISGCWSILFPDTNSVSEPEAPNIARFSEGYKVATNLAIEAAAGAATGRLAGWVSDLTAGRPVSLVSGAGTKGFGSSVGRRPEYRALANVARTISLSPLET